MTVEQMRTELIKAYPGPAWKVKVSLMHDTQVQALYLKFKKTGKIS